MNCRIISINTELSKKLNPIKNSEKEMKIRYDNRRENVINFISNFKDNFFELSLFDAATPKDFESNSKFIKYKDVNFEYIDEYQGLDGIIFYAAGLLSHYEIWNIDEDTLIFEDDILLDNQVFQNIKPCLEEFKTINNDNKVLYLQRSIPWHPSNPDKYYQLESCTNLIGKYVGGDIAGTAAIFITKECKKILLNNIRKLCAADRYFDKLQQEGVIQYYMPKNINNMFKLDVNLSSLLSIEEISSLNNYLISTK
jgi:GR25 family glycosyltransferase involved in LPS biosynthesis